ncbi:MAG: lipopolysaccharide biosynthesis protein [Candidatus Stahlbacteria bacterium]|nr:lipopolysaccharide biosynthesis protein [Candidatus Stahlbacteria bacterium]
MGTKNQPTESLSRKVVRGGIWVFGLNLTVRGLGLIRTIILARLLIPLDFGLVGIATIAISALEVFTATGFSTALIQKKGTATDYLDTVWCIEIIRSIGLAIILLFLAPIIAGFFENTKAVPVLRVMAITMGISAFRNIGIIYFDKEFQFNKQFVYNLGTEIASLSISIYLAFILRNVWAIIYGTLAGTIAKIILSYILHPYRPKLKFEVDKAKELFSFGKWILGSGIIIFLMFHGDDAFVGKFLGTAALGFYTMAYTISNLPATEITGVISRVTFPAYSKLQNDIPKLREGYIKVLQLTAFLSFPLSGGIFILAPDFTKIFLGDKWMPMVPAMQVLTLFGMIRAIGAATAQLFQGVGQPKTLTKMEALALFLLAILIYPLSIRWGILGTALAATLATLIPAMLSFYKAVKIIDWNMMDLSKVILPPLINTGIMILIIFALKRGNIVGITNFLLFIAIGILSYFYTTYLFMKFFKYRILALIKESISALGG